MKNKLVAHEIKHMSNLCMRYMENNSNKEYIDSVTGTNCWIIGYLADKEGEDVFQRDLEKKFGITRSTASKVIGLMVQKGLIEYKSVDYDARLKKLALTPKANELACMMKNDISMLEGILLEGISAEEKEVFLKCVDKMKNNLKNKTAKGGHGK